MYDFVVIGDILIDRILVISEPDVIRSVDEVTHSVTFPYPKKIQLDQPPQSFPGGNAFNAAVALRTLGLNVALCTMIGNDKEGEGLINDVKSKGINCDAVSVDSTQPTNSSVILSIGKDRIIFSHHYARQYKLPNIPETKYIYLTSIGEDDLPLLQQIIALKKEQNFKLIFSPGTRQLEEPFTEVKDILANTDILILNKEEAKELSRLNTNSDDNLLQGLFKMGPKSVIMTRSGHGSLAFDGTNVLKVGAMKVDVVDTTGAGDAYSSTVGAALSMGKDLKTAMEMGAINAGNSVREYGATTGILDMPKLEAEHQAKAAELVYTEPTVNSYTSKEGVVKTSNPL